MNPIKPIKEVKPTQEEEKRQSRSFSRSRSEKVQNIKEDEIEDMDRKRKFGARRINKYLRFKIAANPHMAKMKLQRGVRVCKKKGPGGKGKKFEKLEFKVECQFADNTILG